MRRSGEATSRGLLATDAQAAEAASKTAGASAVPLTRSRVVFGAESNFHFAYHAFEPDDKRAGSVLRDKYPPAPTAARHLQAGTVMGPAGEVAALLRAAMASYGVQGAGRGLWTGTSDQSLLSLYYSTQWHLRRRAAGASARAAVVGDPVGAAAGVGHGVSASVVRRSCGGGKAIPGEEGSFCSQALVTEAQRFCCLPILDHCQRLFAISEKHTHIDASGGVVSTSSSSSSRGAMNKAGGAAWLFVDEGRLRAATGVAPVVLHAPGTGCRPPAGAGCLLNALARSSGLVPPLLDCTGADD